MDQIIPRDAMRPLEDQIRECFGRVVYSHKAHEKTADLLAGRLATVKLWQIVLSAIVTGGLIATLFGSADTSRIAAVLATIVSTALLILNTYTKDVDLGQAVEKHKETAAKLWAIRESYLSILTDLRAGSTTVQEIQDRRDDLQNRLEDVYAAAPRTLKAAYQRAGIALKKEEELTFSDAEIDRFLPSSLRRSAE